MAYFLGRPERGQEGLRGRQERAWKCPQPCGRSHPGSSPDLEPTEPGIHTHGLGSALPLLTCRAGAGRGEVQPAREVLTASSRASPRSTWEHLSCCRSHLNLQRANA